MNHPTRPILYFTMVLGLALMASVSIASVTLADGVKPPDAGIFSAQPIFAAQPPPPTTFTLTVTIIGSGVVTEKNLTLGSTITVTSGTATQYISPTNVSLTAVAASGWAFSAWSGDLSGTTNPQTVTMTANRNVTATFVQAQSTSTATATTTRIITRTSTPTPTITPTGLTAATLTSIAATQSAIAATQTAQAAQAGTQTAQAGGTQTSQAALPTALILNAYTATYGPGTPSPTSSSLPRTGSSSDWIILAFALALIVFVARYLRRSTA